MQNLSGGFYYTFFKSVYVLCGAEEACPAHNRKVGGSKPPKANAGFSSVGRAFDCRGIQTSNSRWFDSGKPETTTFSRSYEKWCKIYRGFSYTFLKCIWSYSEIVSRLLLSKKNWGRTSYDHPTTFHNFVKKVVQNNLTPGFCFRYWTTDFFRSNSVDGYHIGF